MTTRARATVGWCGVVFVVGVVGLVLNLLAPAHFESGRLGQVLLLANPLVMAAVAAFLVTRCPQHPAGYLLALAATGIGLDSPAKAVLNLGLGGPTSWLERTAASVENTTWLLTYWAIAMLIFWYPTGRLISARWRALPIVTTVLCAAVLVDAAAAPVDADYAAVRTLAPANPLSGLSNSMVAVGFPGYGLCVAVGVISLFIRGRRARRDHDLATAAQIRWLAWSMVVVVTTFLVAELVSVTWRTPTTLVVTGTLTELCPYVLILALAVAVSRHGLFEIDRVVSRTVSYGVVTALLVATYVGLIAGLSALLPTNVNSLVVAAATLAVAALFVPVRRRVQDRVDRRFNRARHDHAVLIEGFAAGLRQGADPADLLTVVHRALEPAHASVWLVTR